MSAIGDYVELDKRLRRSPIDTKRTIERCANVTCPNEIGEGWFVTVHLGDIEHRSVVVVLCVPCAECF